MTEIAADEAGAALDMVFGVDGGVTGGGGGSGGGGSRANKTAEEIDKITEATQRAGEASKQWADSLNGSLEDLIINGKSFREVLAGILKQIASSAITGKGAFGGLFGGQGLGSMLLGGLGFFAQGTNYAPGGMAVVGEQGPELVNLPKGSQVIPNHNIGKAMGGPQKVEVVIIGDEGGTFAPRVSDISTTQAVRVSSITARQQQRNLGAAQAEMQRRGTSI